MRVSAETLVSFGFNHNEAHKAISQLSLASITSETRNEYQTYIRDGVEIKRRTFQRTIDSDEVLKICKEKLKSNHPKSNKARWEKIINGINQLR